MAVRRRQWKTVRFRNVDRTDSVSRRRATRRSALTPHLPAGPTGLGRQWRHERVRARAGLGA
ncbi:MAG TPA: hypothetical protein DCQ52_05505, partial [Acidimicrobiaceae bacterium]|nr:hypothetical protein [Acidimicrobiaceae bacterium]